MLGAWLFGLSVQLSVGILVTFYWRGTWILADMYFFPDSLETSAWFSVGIGFGGVVMLALPQLFQRLSESNENQTTPETASSHADILSRESLSLATQLRKLILRFVHAYVLAFFVVNYWRGSWLLIDVHILPSNPKASAWLTHGIGVVALVVFGHFHSAIAPPGIRIADFGTEAIRPGKVVAPVLAKDMWMFQLFSGSHDDVGRLSNSSP